MHEILMGDLAKACRAPVSRISETAAGLGFVRKNEGRRLRKLTVAEAVKIAVTRELMAAGLPAVAALAIGRQIEDADLSDIISHERRMWLLVRQTDAGEYIFTLADLKKAVEIFTDEPESTEELVAQISSGGQPRNIRIVDLYQVIRAVLSARLERIAAEDRRAAESRVTAYSAAKGASGIQLHRSLKLAVFKNGRGHAIQLDPAMARELAGNLLRLADEAEAPAKPEEIN